MSSACGCPTTTVEGQTPKTCDCGPCNNGDLKGCTCNKKTGCACSESGAACKCPPGECSCATCACQKGDKKEKTASTANHGCSCGDSCGCGDSCTCAKADATA